MKYIFVLIFLFFNNFVFADQSPDGNKIAYLLNSNGNSHIFISNADGTNSKKISKEQGNYFNPAWSPLADTIAFEKKEGGKSYIGVMDLDGNNERMIAFGHLVKNPFWSKDGKQIFFSEIDKDGNIKLYKVDFTGYNLTLISK